MFNASDSSSSAGPKHQWTAFEDGKLVECLMDMATSGKWKADNGTFRPGYQQQSEKMMHEKIPECGIRAQPHIDSRVKLWKKQYFTISEMLGPNGSGFGWNDSEKCITAEKEVFNEWVKVSVHILLHMQNNCTY